MGRARARNRARLRSTDTPKPCVNSKPTKAEANQKRKHLLQKNRTRERHERKNRERESAPRLEHWNSIALHQQPFSGRWAEEECASFATMRSEIMLSLPALCGTCIVDIRANSKQLSQQKFQRSGLI